MVFTPILLFLPVPDFHFQSKRLEVAWTQEKELKPFFTILGTNMRAKRLREITKLDLVLAKDLIDRMQFTSDFLGFMNALAELCTDLAKVGKSGQSKCRERHICQDL